ncbi:electron transfer flavoprotein subunit beta/FixA family protein [Enterobacter sp. Cy-643]|uniref:electron transfer flavoprotein subunit beta/FixA family protein n=1 Tax=Enterobacter sp. Cy-643 TaxID=2608346 RepID=UPI0014226763|nr:electron transfer flavoprotein subunit beta/FixA family protein [Enterobacter sp. Cy-643]NIF34137.1 electron transfer flavoprotein subunit beta/FixA family protein [Enterobacter sp. Cy-643]
MNILLAFKAEPDLAMLAEKDWLAAGQGSLNTAITRPCLGEDESAAGEILLRQAEGLSLTALSIGHERADNFLRQFKALGFQRAVRLQPDDELTFSPASVAALLAAWQQQHSQSLVVMGSRSAEGNSGQTGFYLAEQLGWPCFSRVYDFKLDAERQQVCLKQRHGAGKRSLTVRLPAVLMIESAGDYCLRTPGLRQKLAVKASDVEVLPAKALDNEAAVSPLRGLVHPQRQRGGLIIQGSDVREKVRSLYRDWLGKRMKS